MKAEKFTSAILIAASLFASACGVGVDGSDETAALQRRDAKALEARFQQVRGTYEGELVGAGLEPLQAKLTLWVLNVTESTNPDGTVRIRPALKGRFQLVGPVSPTDYLTLSGDYNELGQISLTNVSAGGAAGGGDQKPVESLSIRGTIVDGKAQLEIVRNQGVWGEFKGVRTTIDASAPPAGEDVEFRERLMRLYAPIEGTYVAVLEGGVERVKVSITITIGEDVTTGLPVLIGQYRRLDFPPGVGERSLLLSYDSTTGRLSIKGTSGGGSVPGSNYFSGTGTWKNGELNASLVDHRGPLGRFKATRQPL